MPRKRARPQERAAHELTADAGNEPESFEEHVRRENTREGLALPGPFGAAPPTLPALTKVAKAVEKRHREQCRRSLRHGVSFEDLDELVNRLQNTRRELWAKNNDQRTYFKAEDRADVWLALATGAAAERGRASEWSEEAAEALDGVADAVRRLLDVFARHPSIRLDASGLADIGFGALRTVLEKRGFTELDSLNALAIITPEDLERAYERLRTRFCSTRAGRPRADWRRDTITLLRETGISRGDAEELADTAGLSAGAAPQERGRAARQKQCARRRRSEKLPSK